MAAERPVAKAAVCGSVDFVHDEPHEPAGGPTPAGLRWTTADRRFDRPVIVAAFEGWNDAGDAASSAVRHLRDRLNADSIAEIDPEEFFDFTSTRPTVQILDGNTRRVEWPSVEFCAADGAVAGTEIITLLGTEPQLKWRSFCEAVLSVARLTNARLVLTLGALLAEVPHTRPTSVFGTSYDPAMALELGLQPSNYEGPTGIVGVLHNACVTAGIPSVSLWAAVPSYVPGATSPKATLALVERITEMLDLRVPIVDLEIASAAYERQVSQLVEEDDETSDYVEQLEVRFDAESELTPSFENFVADIEQFLRSQQD